MAVVSGTTQTYQQVGKRESLADKINMISPTQTPFYSSVRKGKAATAMKEEWQTDALAAATKLNVVIDGNDAVYHTATPTVRLANYIQGLEKSIIVSDWANMVKTAGRDEEIAYQAMKRTKELKRDFEKSLIQNNASRAGSAATAPVMASVESWLTTNPSRGSGGADGGFTAAGTVTAPTDASSTNQRAFTETLLKAQVRACWSAGGEPTVVMVGPVNKQRASGFAGIAAQRHMVEGKGKPSSVAIVGAADIYQSDFGELMMVPNRFQRERLALFLDMDYWEIRFLEDWNTKPLARTGHAERKMLSCAATLISLHEGASGAVADLTVT
jgi:hypothetical protein